MPKDLVRLLEEEPKRRPARPQEPVVGSENFASLRDADTYNFAGSRRRPVREDDYFPDGNNED